VASTSERARTGEQPGPASPSARPARHHNSFGLLRLTLASLVILQHALALTGHENRTALGFWRPVSIGDLAVGGFFGLSGYLLMTSVTRHTPRRFLRLRFFRLFPGFWATLAFVALVAAPLLALGTGRWADYRLTGTNSALSYLGYNATLVILQDGIGSLLATNPWPTALDGSLWSLAPEFACYLILLLATMTVRRLRWSPPVLLVPLVLGSGLVATLAEPLLGSTAGAYLCVLGALSMAFFSGSLLAHLDWLGRPDRRRAALLVTLLAIVITGGLWLPLGPPLLAAAVAAVGTSLTSGWTTKVDARADLSYGVYLYHFIVIQALIAFGVTGLSVRAALTLLAPLTLLIAGILATISWFAVEAPAQRYARRKAPRPATIASDRSRRSVNRNGPPRDRPSE
jgi:peptidoglycan/LPS O-acetylase OafA/YrhL